MNLATWLLRHAALDPAAPALYHGDRLLFDYGALSDRALRIAQALSDRGVVPGDRVVLWMANCPAYGELLWAIWAAGGVVVPVNYKLHPREVADIVRDASPRLAFLDGTASDDLAGVPTIDVTTADYAAMAGHAMLAQVADRRDDDLAWVFYTSGTTGRPKGAMLSFANLRAMAYAYVADVDSAAARHAMLYAAPMSHGAGLYAVAQMLVGGVHVVPASGEFDPDEILALGADGTLPPLSFFAAPTMVRRLVDAAERAGGCDGIATIVYGGGPMYVADIERAVAVMGDQFVQIYGQGETPMTIACLPRRAVGDRAHPRWRERLGSVGLPHSCITLRVVDESGTAQPPGAPGEIVVAGPTVMSGYWRDPAATAAALDAGWLRTGDIGVVDHDGFLTLTDRSKDVIISGGTNIYPREVEEVLLSHPDVVEASVVGMADPEWGESVVAFVVARDNARVDAAALDAVCLRRLARFKRPKAYRFVDNLPKNAYGKVLKSSLRPLLADA